MFGRRDAPIAFGRVTVMGGGCYGAYYVRQLQRAMSANAITCREIAVVDRDADCMVARELSGAVDEIAATVVVSDWDSYMRAYLDLAVRSGDARDDAIVPTPLMPHVMGDWFIATLRDRLPDRQISIEPFEREPSVPWQREAPDGTRFLSFAEWMCPINCIEPAKCPHTRGPRSWSFTDAVPAYAAEESARVGRPVKAVLFHCAHRAYGVGMFETRDVLDQFRDASTAAARGPADFLVGTVSHCHGALRRITVR